MQNLLSIKTKSGEVQIKISVNNGGLATVKSRLIKPDGYENRYSDFIFFPDSYPLSLWPIIDAYFSNKIWFTRKRGEEIIEFFKKELAAIK